MQKEERLECPLAMELLLDWWMFEVVLSMTHAKEQVGACTEPPYAMVNVLLCTLEMKCSRLEGREWRPKKSNSEGGKDLLIIDY